MTEISIKYVGFWDTWNIYNNKFNEALGINNRVRVIEKGSIENPDILFYSRYTKGEHLNYDCIKIYFTGENDFPDFNECDYALSFHEVTFGERHLRYPLYMLYEYDQLSNPLKISDKEAVNRKFCSLLMRNSNNCDPKRLRIIDEVGKYKDIDYGGSFRNNIGGNVDEKIPFIHGYKFNLALENSVVDGYVTEKILEPMVASTIPIYWGSERAKKDFNPEAFINVDDYDNLDNFLKALKRIDEDAELYLKMLRAPKLIKGVSPDFDSLLVEFLDNIAKKRRRYALPFGEIGNLLAKKKKMNPVVNNSLAFNVGRGISKILKTR